MNNITENKKAVLAAKGISTASDKAIHPSKFLDINYLVEKRQAFVKGKFDIGIFAVAMTNLANSQVVGLGITNGTAKLDDQIIMKLNNNNISLPFDEINVLEINGSPFISLSTETDSEDKYTMDKVSGYINGAVDVAKEPDIVEMGMHTMIAGSYMVLEKMGLSGKKTALFLQQPVVREYLKELIYLRNPDFGWSSYTGRKDLRYSLLKKYGGKMPKDKVSFSEADLSYMIEKGEKIKKEQKRIMNGEEIEKPLDWTEAEKQLQYLVFVNFLKVDMFSSNLLESIMGSNHDTSMIRSPYILLRKDFIAEKAKTEGNLVMSPKDDGYQPGVMALRKGTFVQKTIDAYRTFNTLFSDINLFALQKRNPKSVLSTIALRTYKTRKYMSSDDFDKVMKEVEVSMIDTLMNNRVATSKDIKLSAYSKQFFKRAMLVKEDNSQEPLNTLAEVKKAIGLNQKVINANNLSVTYEELKKDFPNLVETNFFLQNLSIDYDQKLDVYLLELDTKPMQGDILTRNLLIDGFRQILGHPNPKVQKFADMVTIGTILQYGVKYQRSTITPFIPHEVYTKYSEAAFENIDNEQFPTFEEEVLRENSFKKDFIQEVVPFNTMDFLEDDGKIHSVWSNKTAEEKRAKLRPRLSARTFITADEKIRPSFFWRGYLDELSSVDDFSELMDSIPAYINVKIVKPEYVQRKWVEISEDYAEWRNVLVPEVYKMIKNKDFSWAFTQTYKLVGADGTTPSVIRETVFTSGKNKGRTSLSVLYKPINTYGWYNFGEKAQLTMDDSGNVIGKDSILKVHENIKEQTDEEIHSVIMKNTKDILKFTKYNPAVFNQADYYIEPIAAELVTRDLGIKNVARIITPPNLPPIDPTCD